MWIISDSIVYTINGLNGKITATTPNSTLLISTSGQNVTFDINLANANRWTAIQTFGADTYFDPISATPIIISKFPVAVGNSAGQIVGNANSASASGFYQFLTYNSNSTATTIALRVGQTASGTATSGVVATLNNTLDDSNGSMTIAGNTINFTDTFDGLGGVIKFTGSSTGITSLKTANAGASNFTVTIPAATGTVALTSGANVASVSNSDGTLTISPTTGAVVASLALGNANTWTAAQTLTGQIIHDGWITTADTWVFVSAVSFKINSVDRTAIFTKGTRVSWNDGSVKYGTVASSAFSTNTTVTLITNSDYSIANATITAPRYSYSFMPKGYPVWFNYTPTLTGWSVAPTGAVYRFMVIGNACFLHQNQIQGGVYGTSNTTGVKITIPVGILPLDFAGAVCTTEFDNGSALTTAGRFYVTAGSTQATADTNMAGGLWTASGGKAILGDLVFAF